jgi:hypothetical protein
MPLGEVNGGNPKRTFSKLPFGEAFTIVHARASYKERYVHKDHSRAALEVAGKYRMEPGEQKRR